MEFISCKAAILSPGVGWSELNTSFCVLLCTTVFGCQGTDILCVAGFFSVVVLIRDNALEAELVADR